MPHAKEIFSLALLGTHTVGSAEMDQAVGGITGESRLESLQV